MRPINIVVAEDDDDDWLITSAAFATLGISNVERVPDGDVLLTRLKDHNKPKVDLVFLDIAMPKVNGFQVLSTMRADHKLKVLPVVVFTTSKAAGDILKAYQLGANTYVQKPLHPSDTLGFLSIMRDYWGEVASLPLAA